MKKIEEKIEQVIVKTKITFESIDGKRFDSETECKDYENSAKCACLADLKGAIIKDVTENQVFDCGSEECSGFTIIPRDSNDIFKLNQYMYLVENGYHHEDMSDAQIGKNIIVFENYEHDCVWWYDIDAFVENIKKNLFQKVSKE